MGISKQFKLTLTCGVMFSLLAGCQTAPNQMIDASQQISPLSIIANESQNALIAQKSLANASEQSMKTLAIRQSKINHDLILVNYIGLPEPLLESVALQFGYRYIESGRASSLPIINFTNRRITGVETLKDVASFLGNQADITIDHQNKTIVLTYKAI